PFSRKPWSSADSQFLGPGPDRDDCAGSHSAAAEPSHERTRLWGAADCLRIPFLTGQPGNSAHTGARRKLAVVDPIHRVWHWASHQGAGIRPGESSVMALGPPQPHWRQDELAR